MGQGESKHFKWERSGERQWERVKSRACCLLQEGCHPSIFIWPSFPLGELRLVCLASLPHPPLPCDPPALPPGAIAIAGAKAEEDEGRSSEGKSRRGLRLPPMGSGQQVSAPSPASPSSWQGKKISLLAFGNGHRGLALEEILEVIEASCSPRAHSPAAAGSHCWKPLPPNCGPQHHSRGDWT